MAFVTPEQVHRYPRRLMFVIELLSASLVLVAVVRWGRAILQFLWDQQGQHIFDFAKKDWFLDIIRWLNQGGVRGRFTSINQLTPHFIWLVVALFAALFMRSFFPIIRTSGRGMLIEWSNSWLPVGWEQIQGLRATEDLAGERFVVLLQTNNKALTGWHRFYSFLYRLSFRRGIIITSAISNFLPLIQTITSELEQVARQTKQTPVRLDEQMTSPLFQLLLSPAGFFSRRSKSDIEYVAQATEAAKYAQAGKVATLMATYPTRIRSLIVGATSLLAIFGILRVGNILRRWVGVTFPDLQNTPLFKVDPLPINVHAWWLPIAAIIMLVLLIPILVVLRNILPDVESRPEGLMVRYFNRWLRVPWNEVTAVKSADLSEQNHVVLLQTTKQPLHRSHYASSLLFDGSSSKGVLLTSALSAFEPLVQQIVLEVSRGARSNDDDEGILHENAPAWMLHLAFKPSEAIDRLMAYIEKRKDTLKVNVKQLIHEGRPMIWLAAIPTVMLIVQQWINRGHVPTISSVIGIIFFFIFCLIEWPLAAGLAQFIEGTADDSQGARPFYLYPLVQLPRILVMIGALLLLLLGVPLLPLLLWFGGAIWSFLLTAGLWEGMYGWSGTKLLGMGAIPAVFQIITMSLWAVLS